MNSSGADVTQYAGASHRYLGMLLRLLKEVSAPLSTAVSADSLPISRLQCTLNEILLSLTSILADDLPVAERQMIRAATSLRTRPKAALPEESACNPVPDSESRGGLAPWQVRSLIAHVDARLEHAFLSNSELAGVARLSRFHFCRSFRLTFGCPPRQYIIRRRVERSQGLMLRSRLTLAQIAVECGFSDQAHFNHVFRRVMGESPGAWRRSQQGAAAVRIGDPQLQGTAAEFISPAEL